jgi:hypothetical protein
MDGEGWGRVGANREASKNNCKQAQMEWMLKNRNTSVVPYGLRRETPSTLVYLYSICPGERCFIGLRIILANLRQLCRDVRVGGREPKKTGAWRCQNLLVNKKGLNDKIQFSTISDGRQNDPEY